MQMPRRLQGNQVRGFVFARLSLDDEAQVDFLDGLPYKLDHVVLRKMIKQGASFFIAPNAMRRHDRHRRWQEQGAGQAEDHGA